MKQQILSRYTELCEKSHFKFLPQIKTYLEQEKEEIEDEMKNDTEDKNNVLLENKSE